MSAIGGARLDISLCTGLSEPLIKESSKIGLIPCNEFSLCQDKARLRYEEDKNGDAYPNLPWRPGGRHQGVNQVTAHIVTSIACNPLGSPVFRGTELKCIVNFPENRLSLCSHGSCERSLLVSIWERRNLESAKLVGSCALELIGIWVVRNFCLGFASGKSGTRQDYSSQAKLLNRSAGFLCSLLLPPLFFFTESHFFKEISPQSKNIFVPMVCISPNLCSRKGGVKLFKPWNK